MKTADRIIELSKKMGLSHIGSCLSALPILEEIYQTKAPGDIVILDCAHSHLSHLVVREKYEGLGDIESLIQEYGIHCDKNANCDASGGSLGHGIGISIGFALSDRSRGVHCLVSDGSMMEGSNWEALRLRDSLKLTNLIIYCNFNGFSAVAPVDLWALRRRMGEFGGETRFYWTSNGEGFEGVQGHYKVI